MNNKRRKILKGLVYGSVLSATSLPTLAFSVTNPTNETNTLKTALNSTSDITISRKKVNGKEQVTLINNTHITLALNSDQPITMEYGNGFLSIKPNEDIHGGILLSPSEHITFEIDAYNVEQIFASLSSTHALSDNLLCGRLNIISEHHAFNHTIPVTSLNVLAAA